MNIKKTLLTTLILAASLKIASAQEPKLYNNSDVTNKPNTTEITQTKSETTVMIDNTVTNKNMFFGLNFGNNTMNQLYTELNRGTERDKINCSTWTNFDTKKGEIVEIDLLMSYIKNIKINDKNLITIQPTLGYYTFPNGEMSDCQEIYLRANYSYAKTPYSGPINVKIKAGKAFGRDSGKGYMIGANISKTINLIKDRISTTASIGSVFNSEYFAQNSKGISHLEGTISASYTPTSNISFSTSFTSQKRVNKSFEGKVFNENYWKAGVTWTF